MAYDGLNWQKLELPYAAGLNQGTDDRARPQPFLDICRDAQFDEDGGLQTRYPFATSAGSIFGGGTISNARRIERYGTELVLFTKDTLYSWNAQLSKWVSRGTHLAVKVAEEPRFVTTGDQIDGDRAELSGTVVYAWTEGTQVYAAALDKTTGSVLVSPTAVSTAIGRPRLVALATKILLFVEATATLLTVRSIDPAAPGTAIAGAGTTVLTTDFNLYYDVVKAGTQDLVVGACRRVTTTSYTVFTVTPTLTVTAVTKARTADGPVAVATIANGTQTQVARGNGTNVQGDLLTTSTLADVFTGQAIGTVAGAPINQIAAAFSSTTCTVLWSAQEVSDNSNPFFATKSNTVTTANVVGAQATMVLRLGVASRALAFDGNVYVWTAFAGDSTTFGSGSPSGVRAQLQNTYFFYRSDGVLVSKATWQVAGGFSPSTGHLPGVVGSGNDFSWLGAFRRQIGLGGDGHTGGAARSLRDIAFSFDSNEARRAARIGRTLYITGGIIQQYDGGAPVELGFCVYPWAFVASDSGVAGNPDGTYSLKSTLRWINGMGEVERSTTATGERVTVVTNEIAVAPFFLYVTRKTATVPAIEVWRTATNPNEDAPYYLVTGQDPDVVTGSNCYIKNDITNTGTFSLVDDYSDATLTTKETNPENGAVLESLTPPGASIIAATDTRLFLAGVAGDADAVWYSRERGEGEIASFHDSLRVLVPRDGGSLTSIAFLDGTLFAFRQTAIYALPGVGFDNFGGGQNFGPARIVSLDVGAVSHESVALTPEGLIFKSSKGWYMLHGNGALEYIGAKVSDFDTDTVYAVTVVETQHQVRILTSGRMIVWDYKANQWGEWTVTDGLHACMFNGAHVYLTSTGTRTQSTSYAGLTYGMDVERTWIKPADLLGAIRVRRLQPLGEYRSAFLLRARIAYNYQVSGGNPVYVDDKAWTPSPATVGGPLQVKLGPSRRRCQAFKLRLSAYAAPVVPVLEDLGAVMRTLPDGDGWDASLTGNGALAIAIAVSAVAVIDVRDNQVWNGAAWVSLPGTCGVRLEGNATTASVTVAAFEAAINATSTIAYVVTPHSVAGVLIDIANSDASIGIPFATSGEAMKLTSLGLEVGVEPGLFRRLPAAQKV